MRNRWLRSVLPFLRWKRRRRKTKTIKMKSRIVRPVLIFTGKSEEGREGLNLPHVPN